MLKIIIMHWVNLRAGILFSEEHESIAIRESGSRLPTLVLLHFHTPSKKECLIVG